VSNLLEFHICAYDKEDRFSSRQLGWIKAVDTDVFIYLHVLFASGVDHSYAYLDVLTPDCLVPCCSLCQMLNKQPQLEANHRWSVNIH